MATIIHKKIEGHGPYAYRVTYSDGQHHWEYLGKVDDSSDDEQDLTNDDEEGDSEMEYEREEKEHVYRLLDVYDIEPEQVEMRISDEEGLIGFRPADDLEGHERDVVEDQFSKLRGNRQDLDHWRGGLVIDLDDTNRLLYRRDRHLLSSKGERIGMTKMRGSEDSRTATLNVDYDDKEVVKAAPGRAEWDSGIEKWYIHGSSEEMRQFIEYLRDEGYEVTMDGTTKSRLGEEPEL